MKKISIIVIALLACAACAKKPNNTSEPAKASQGTVTESKPAAETVAVARILAAQFATLIAPSDTSASRAAAQA